MRILYYRYYKYSLEDADVLHTIYYILRVSSILWYHLEDADVRLEAVLVGVVLLVQSVGEGHVHDRPGVLVVQPAHLPSERKSTSTSTS